MEDVVGAILDSLKQEGVIQQGAVKEVKLKVGALDIHSAESFAQAFTSLTQGTLLEGAPRSGNRAGSDSVCEVWL
jgi:Zn finger protein HypA/HybF involved in hydrogenase expression